MLKAIKFVSPAVHTGEHRIEILKYINVFENRATAFNDLFALSAPMDLNCDGNFNPKVLRAALENLDDSTPPILSQVRTGLQIQSGKFKVVVPVSTAPFPAIPTLEANLPISGILAALKIVRPFVMGKTGINNWARSVYIRGNSVFATDGPSCVELWIPEAFPGEVKIPAETVDAMIKLGVEPEFVGLTETQVKFVYPGDRWLWSRQEFDWPDPYNILDGGWKALEVIPEEFFPSIRKLKDFSEDNHVAIRDGELHSTTASIECAGVKKSGSFSWKHLALFDGIASRWGFNGLKAMFAGGMFRGVTLGIVDHD